MKSDLTVRLVLTGVSQESRALRERKQDKTRKKQGKALKQSPESIAETQGEGKWGICESSCGQKTNYTWDKTKTNRDKTGTGRYKTGTSRDQTGNSGDNTETSKKN